MRKFLLVSFLLIDFGGSIFAQGTGKITGKVIFGGDKSPLHQVSVKITELVVDVLSPRSISAP